MRLIANRQLTGDYGFVLEGHAFEADEPKAQDLMRRGLAHAADPPKILYSTKVIVPEAPEVRARQPFRDVPVPDAEQAGVAPESDPVLSGSDLPEKRLADSGGRPGRKGSSSKG